MKLAVLALAVLASCNRPVLPPPSEFAPAIPIQEDKTEPAAMIAGKSLSAWVSALDDVDPKIRSEAIDMVSRAEPDNLTPAKAGLAHIITMKGSSTRDIARAAATLYFKCRVDAPPEVASALLDGALNETDEEFCIWEGMTLSSLTRKNPAVGEDIKARLRQEPPSPRRESVAMMLHSVPRAP